MADVDRTKYEMSSNLGLPRMCMLDQTKVTAKPDVIGKVRQLTWSHTAVVNPQGSQMNRRRPC